MPTIWVFGDQLNTRIGALASADPDRDTILMIESRAALRTRPFHRQRLHFVLASMRKFAAALRQAGFRDCRFDPGRRVGDDACPFTTLYWDFLDRHRGRLGDNVRLARQYATLDRLSDMDEVRNRADQVVEAFGEGRL